jgi:outer membrane phospholipase A
MRHHNEAASPQALSKYLGLGLAAVAALLAASTCHAIEADKTFCLSKKDADGLDHPPALCTYEPTTLGWTKDSDDVGFMDFKLSVRYQILHFPDKNDKDDNWATYFAFTGRFGQYLGTRDSSPVVTKRLNPKVFYRHWTDKHGSGDYFDVGYNHESNGQSINTSAGFTQAQNEAILKDGSPNAAYDQISRGWDYLDFVWRKKVTGDGNAYLMLKYFLPRGLLQGKAEEYGTNFAESDPEGKPRNRVNGIGAMFKQEFKDCLGATCKFVAFYETGYRSIARYNTLRVETGFKVLQIPLMIWGQTGYGSDLAQYYKKVSSAGIAVEIGSF